VLSNGGVGESLNSRIGDYRSTPLAGAPLQPLEYYSMPMY